MITWHPDDEDEQAPDRSWLTFTTISTPEWLDELLALALLLAAAVVLTALAL